MGVSPETSVLRTSKRLFICFLIRINVITITRKTIKTNAKICRAIIMWLLVESKKKKKDVK